MAEAGATAQSGEPPVDGRTARRQRNLDAVLDVVLEMFAEDMMFPSIEQASNRSGLSMRSLYRYFTDPRSWSRRRLSAVRPKQPN